MQLAMDLLKEQEQKTAQVVSSANLWNSQKKLQLQGYFTIKESGAEGRLRTVIAIKSLLQ